MRISSNIYLEEIVDGKTKWSAIGDCLVYDNEVISEEEARRVIAKAIKPPSPSKVQTCIECIKENCQIKTGGVSLYDSWLNTQKLPTKITKPVLFELFDDIELEQILASIVQNKAQHVTLFVGMGNAGKSFIMDALLSIYQHMAETKSIFDFNKQFGLHGINSKLLIYNYDLGEEFIGNLASGVFKKACSGEPFQIEGKGSNKITVENCGKFAFCSNYFPRYSMYDRALHKRVVCVTFNQKLELPESRTYEEWKAAIKEDGPNLLAYLLTVVIKDFTILKYKINAIKECYKIWHPMPITSIKEANDWLKEKRIEPFDERKFQQHQEVMNEVANNNLDWLDFGSIQQTKMEFSLPTQEEVDELPF